MTKEDLIKHAQRISADANDNLIGTIAEAREFLSNYGGPNNSFVQSLDRIDKPGGSRTLFLEIVQSTLSSFVKYVENDLLRAISLEREVQIETVSDYLEQASTLINDKNVHPAAPGIIIGASLEEFLRNWLEEIEFDLTSIKNSLDSYAKELRALELITKQDIKDITSWGGIRNDAAHGHWQNVEDRDRIKIMLDGVNLFMRKYSD
jgi:hypothetical protein